MNWYPHKNAAGIWCTANRSGEHIACADHDAALAECDRLNADEALADREDLRAAELAESLPVPQGA